MGDYLEIKSIQNDKVRAFAESAGKKYSDGTEIKSIFTANGKTEVEGNNNEFIDTKYEKSSLRGFIAKGLENGTIERDADIERIAKYIELDLKEDKNEEREVSKESVAAYEKFFNDKDNKKTYHNHDEAYKAAKKELKKAGVSKEERKRLDKYVDNEARKIVYELWENNHEDIDKTDIKESARKALIARGLYNKRTKDVLNGGVNFLGWLNGDQSQEKRYRDCIAHRNTFEQVKDLGRTREQWEKGFEYTNPNTHRSKKLKGLGESLVNRYLEAGVLEERDGKIYDKKLANILQGDGVKPGIVGDDHTVNVQHDDIHHYEERKLLRGRINNTLEIYGQEELSKTEVKNTAKTMGEDWQPKHRWSPLNAIIGGAVGFGSGALSAYTNPDHGIDEVLTKDGDVRTVNLKYSVNTEYGQAIINNQAAIEESGAAVSVVDGIVRVVVKGKGDVTPILYKAPKDIIRTGVKIGLLGAAYGALDGIKSNSEPSVFRKDLNCDEIAEYVAEYKEAWKKQGLSDAEIAEKSKTAELDALKLVINSKYTGGETAEVRSALLLIAKAVAVKVDKDGVLHVDCDEFNRELTRMAGDGSVLNIDELRAGLRKAIKELEQANETTTTEKVSFKGETQCTPSVTTTKDVEYDLIKGKNEDWGVFATRYSCLNDYDKEFAKKVYDKELKKMVPGSYARTMMKIMQAIKDDNYEITRLQRLTKLAEDGDLAALSKEPGFDYATYKALRGGATIRQKLVPVKKDGKVICSPEDPEYNRIYKGAKGGVRVEAQKDKGTEVTPETFTGRLMDDKGNKFNTNNKIEFNNTVKEWSITKENKGIKRIGCDED